MSVYKTLELTETECIELIARHMGVFEDSLTKQQLLSAILLKITDENEFSPYCYNNYSVKEDK